MFLTGLYYKPEQFPYSLLRLLPGTKKSTVLLQLEKRRLPELNPETIVSIGGPWPEIVFRPLSLYRQWLQMHDWLASRWLMNQKVSEEHILLHCYDGSSARTMHAARAKGIITIYEITGPVLSIELAAEERRRLGLSETRNRSWNKWVEHLINEYKAADYIIAQSNATVEYVRRLGVLANKIVLLPLGVDTTRFQPSASDKVDRPFRVLFVGQLGIHKGLQHLLEAWKQLDLPNSELILAGTVSKKYYGDMLLEKYKGIYKWLGFVGPELPKVYQESDVFVLPSLSEGTSMAMQEAMASGLPCIISTNVGCIMQNGIEGIIIPVGDVEALKNGIQRLYGNQELRQRMGIAARIRAEQFTWREYGRRLAAIYRMIHNGERRSASEILDMTIH
jgi:glycosyltransferase involved in cell wall biosynthesis